MGYPNILLPATVVLGSDQTTAAGAELTALSTTLTNPQNAGRALVTASASLKSPTVVADIYTCRLYKDSTVIAETVVEVRATAARPGVRDRYHGGQVDRYPHRRSRSGSSGHRAPAPITVDGLVPRRTQISWIFVPNAQVV